MGLFIAGTIDSIGYIYHVDHNGGLVWKYEYGKEFTHRYPGSRGTPTVEGNRLYYSGTLGDAVCLNASTGEVFWNKNIPKLTTVSDSGTGWVSGNSLKSNPFLILIFVFILPEIKFEKCIL